jgi:cobaltochelatase CobT
MSTNPPSIAFKNVLAGASRAIAHEPEVEVAWTADAPVPTATTSASPMPGRNLPREQRHGSARARPTVSR